MEGGGGGAWKRREKGEMRVRGTSSNFPGQGLSTSIRIRGQCRQCYPSILRQVQRQGGREASREGRREGWREGESVTVQWP